MDLSKTRNAVDDLEHPAKRLHVPSSVPQNQQPENVIIDISDDESDGAEFNYDFLAGSNFGVSVCDENEVDYLVRGGGAEYFTGAAPMPSLILESAHWNHKPENVIIDNTDEEDEEHHVLSDAEFNHEFMADTVDTVVQNQQPENVIIDISDDEDDEDAEFVADSGEELPSFGGAIEPLCESVCDENEYDGFFADIVGAAGGGSRGFGF